MKNDQPRGAGFSPLELMTAYRAHVAKAHRLDAAAALMRAVQFVETAHLAQASATGDAMALPVGLDQAPSSGSVVIDATGLRQNHTTTPLDAAHLAACWTG